MALKRTGDATTDRCDEVDDFRNGESTIKEERRRCGEDKLPGLPMLFRLISSIGGVYHSFCPNLAGQCVPTKCVCVLEPSSTMCSNNICLLDTNRRRAAHNTDTSTWTPWLSEGKNGCGIKSLHLRASAVASIRIELSIHTHGHRHTFINMRTDICFMY